MVSRPKLVPFSSSVSPPRLRRPGPASHFRLTRSYSADSPNYEPLRILFCGSDAFSCASLQALYNDMLQQKTDGPSVSPNMPGRIASLDVVVRPAKRTGRGLKQVVHSTSPRRCSFYQFDRPLTTGVGPVKLLATELGLPVHERDTFTAWTPPPSPSGLGINLIVAVSFGLFVPPRLLRAARFGGLNVHPSLLPDLHGAAPIEHAVLLGRPRTGVTVQTLHETTFDGGRRLLQGPTDLSEPAQPAEAKEEAMASATAQPTTTSPQHIVGLPLDDRVTAAELHQLLAPIGAHLLTEVLRRGLYLPERASKTAEVTYTPPFPPQAAPKLNKADRQVLWRTDVENATQTTTSADIDRQARALGALWTHLEVPPSSKATKLAAGQSKRAILDDVDLVACPNAAKDTLRAVLEAGHQLRLGDGSTTWPSDVRTLTFVQDTAAAPQQQQRVTLPFVVDGESIVVPVGVHPDRLEDGQSCLRIGSIKVEGYSTKPAARAIGAFANKSVSTEDVSWDVVLRV